MKIFNSDKYISTVGTGVEVSAETEEIIKHALKNKPAAPKGFAYKLCADTFEWELVELPPEPIPADDELTAEEALNIITGGAT